MPVQNAEIAAMFDRAAELLEIKGENPFRTRAYRRAARVIEGLPKGVTSLLKAGEDLSELPGIGKDLAGTARLPALSPPENSTFWKA
jgi:DNA polymerase (family 10)